MVDGIDYVDETGESQGELDFNVFSVPTDFNIERDYFAYFAEGQINLTTDLSATVAARVDDTEQDSVFHRLLTWLGKWTINTGSA